MPSTSLKRREPPSQTPQLAADRSTDFAVGERIRFLRLARGLSLKELAERAGLSIALISQIERGVSSASVRVLARLSDGLHVSIADLFEAPIDEGDNDRIVARVKDRRRIDLKGTGIFKEWLTPLARQPRLDLYLMTIEPDGHSGNDSFAHEGEEAGLVLEGGIELFVDGRKLVLGEGDAFRFESGRQHRYRNAGRTPAKIIWVLYRDGEG